MTEIGDLSDGVLRELMYLFVGEKIGDGSARKVYSLRQDDTKVVKIETGSSSFQNIIEWEIWTRFKNNTRVAKWLAPCHWISASGTHLIMSKCDNLRSNEIPKKVPKFLIDHKPDNFGLLDGKVVCRDYGLLGLTPDTSLDVWRAYAYPFRE